MVDPGFALNPDQEPRDFRNDTARAMDEVPQVSYSSQSNGFNAGSTDSVAQGTLGINTSPSANTVFWIAYREGSSRWSEIV